MGLETKVIYEVQNRSRAEAGPRRRVTSRTAAVFISVLLVALFHAVLLVRQAPLLYDAKLRNPDSYYKIVTLMDHTQDRFNWVARDNAPNGSWVHWSMPHATTVWQVHRLLRLAGLAEEPALRYAGGAVTLLSMLLVALFIALALAPIAPQRAIMVSGLLLATSLPILGYARVTQITHHIFMLVPLAAAAACLMQRPEMRRPLLAACGGALLGLALWVSPETMPFVVGLVGVRLALRLQHPDSASLWPIAVGMALTTTWAWTTDPPPPGFSAWAVDHISLAYIVLVALLGVWLIAGDVWARRRLPLPHALLAQLGLGVALGLVWLWTVPGAMNGPAGLIPAELQQLFWNHIDELRPARRGSEWVAFFATPVAAAMLAGYGAWRRRSLWLLTLGLFALSYGLLAVWHIRMGTAASVAAALAFCAGAASLRGMEEHNDGALSRREWLAALAIALFPHTQLVASGLLSWAEAAPPKDEVTCNLAPVAEALNRLPPSTILTTLSSGPELLYRTHHRVIAGPYHHNVGGMLDNFHAWLDAGDGRAEEVLRRRQVDYVLGCVRYQAALQGAGSSRSLAQRVAAGDVPGWLEPIGWPPDTQTGWRLYRVQLTPGGQP